MVVSVAQRGALDLGLSDALSCILLVFTVLSLGCVILDVQCHEVLMHLLHVDLVEEVYLLCLEEG